MLLLGAGLHLAIRAGDARQAADQAVLELMAEARTPALTGVARLADQLPTFAVVMALRLATVWSVIYGRFRQLAVFLATLVVTDWVVIRPLFVELPRPDVPVLVDRASRAPSPPGDLGPGHHPVPR